MKDAKNLLHPMLPLKEEQCKGDPLQLKKTY